jgi:uncharacterized protein YodC (DUF2158 family)
MTAVGTLKSGDPVRERWLRAGRKQGDVLCKWLDESSMEEKIYPFPLSCWKPRARRA